MSLPGDAKAPGRIRMDWWDPMSEEIMKRFQFVSGAVAAAALLLLSGGVRAASTAQFTDQWWTSSESGWGAAVVQQANMLGVDLMVYGVDGKPAWYVVWAPNKPDAPAGHTVFSGDLYATTGPWFGGPFNPGLVAERKVGTLTFDATGPNSAAITYSVDGVNVAKSVSRMTWGRDNLTGSYDGTWMMRCGFPAYPSPFDWFVTLTTVEQDAAGGVSIVLTCPMCWDDFRHEFRGTYEQTGRLGTIRAQLVAPDAGSVTFTEVEKTTVGFTGRLAGTMTISGVTCQTADSRVGAAIQ
jgi:hypothetical protein